MTPIEVLTDETVDVGLIQSFIEKLPEKALQFGVRVLLALLVFAIGAQLIKLVCRILKKSMQRGNADVGVIQFLGSFVRITLYVLLVFFIASGFGLDAASVVALLGSAGGVLILLLKPFKVGDYIIAGNGNEGTVVEIQIFYTKLTTADNRLVVIPNGELSNSSMINASAMPTRRIDIPVGISYEADIRQARNVLTELLEKDEKVLQDMDKRVFVDSLGDSAVMLDVRCHVASEDFWETRWRLTENIKYALDEADISIPYNQLDVHLKEHAAGNGH